MNGNEYLYVFQYRNGSIGVITHEFGPVFEMEGDMHREYRAVRKGAIMVYAYDSVNRIIPKEAQSAYEDVSGFSLVRGRHVP